MFKAIRTIKKIKQLQKAMHDLGLVPDSEKGRTRAKSFHDLSHMIKDVLDGKSVDEAMTRLEIKVKIEEVEQEDDEN